MCGFCAWVTVGLFSLNFVLCKYLGACKMPQPQQNEIPSNPSLLGKEVLNSTSLGLVWKEENIFESKNVIESQGRVVTLICEAVE